MSLFGKILSKLGFDSGAEVAVTANPGLPDGMKTDTAGNLFTTGPGGVLVFAPDGRLLGTIRVGGPVANVTYGGPKRDILFLTAHDRLIRIPTKTQGHQPIGRMRGD